MKTKQNIFLTILLSVFVFWGCRSTQKGSNYLKVDVEARNSSLQLNLKSPINSADENELARSVYSNKTYFLVQNKDDQFKDNAPFIEQLEGGLKERMWFTSSRAAENYGAKSTNHYQQIYYADREVGSGKCPNEGWSAPLPFTIATDNPMLSDFYNAFNRATKGAVAIVGDNMIITCDQLVTGAQSEFKQLWSLTRVNGKFDNPKPLTVLSNGKTWESQPTLSANGNHLFFVSNRKVDTKSFEVNSKETGNDLNIFYSFKKENNWTEPILVKELCSTFDEVTPQFAERGTKLYFASNKNSQFNIYEVGVKLNDQIGGYSMDKENVSQFSRPLIDFCNEKPTEIVLNDSYNQKYPFYYYNRLNSKVPQALYWSSDDPKGMGSYDIYGCAMPFKVDLMATLKDKCTQGGNDSIEFPEIELSGYTNQKVEASSAHFTLYSGLKYQLKGGSTASIEKGTYHCDKDAHYIFIGYSEIKNQKDASNKSDHYKVIQGSVVNSELTSSCSSLPVFNVMQDTVLNDTIFITKAWMRKPPCPDVLEIPQKYHSIAYFQSGFWEVNTSENFKRDMELLHDGYEVTSTNDIYNPTGKINCKRTDYKAFGWEESLFPINPKDKSTYSIANARWIELHPNNYYWGDRPGFDASITARMQGRRDRINQYLDFARKVDENLTILTDTIKEKYISFLDLHRNRKPKLLIEIFAVSDQREVTRGWYIGDTVQYRGSEYLGDNKFKTETVKIIPPKVDESTKTIVDIQPCTIELNADGNNGSKLGITSDKTDLNTNLSRLRAWHGYQEVFKRLTNSKNFDKYLNAGKVALPDNDVSYEDADIVIITRGRRIDIIDPQKPFPAANNANGQGFYDFDQIRRVEIRIRLLYEDKNAEVKSFCCDSK